MIKLHFNYYRDIIEIKHLGFSGFLFLRKIVFQSEVNLLTTFIVTTSAPHLHSSSSVITTPVSYRSDLSPIACHPFSSSAVRTLPSREKSTILNCQIFHFSHPLGSLLSHVLFFKSLKHSWSFSLYHFKVRCLSKYLWDFPRRIPILENCLEDRNYVLCFCIFYHNWP